MRERERARTKERKGEVNVEREGGRGGGEGRSGERQTATGLVERSERFIERTTEGEESVLYVRKKRERERERLYQDERKSV